MKKFLTVLMFSFLFVSCEKVEDDSDLVCTQSCTSAMGKVYTHSNIVLKNVMMKFRFQKSVGTGGLYTRIISKKRTNQSGEYAMDFYLKNEELGMAVGHFDLYPDKNTLPGTVFYPSYGHLFHTMMDIQNRDFTLQKDLYIPTKKIIKVKLNNFVPVLQDDYFSVEILLPCGYDSDEINPDTGNKHHYVNTGINRYTLNQNTTATNKQFDVECALNEPNYIKVIRYKNGVYSQEYFLINVTTDTNEIFEYSY